MRKLAVVSIAIVVTSPFWLPCVPTAWVALGIALVVAAGFSITWLDP